MLNDPEYDNELYLKNTEKFSKVCNSHFQNRIEVIKEVVNRNWTLPVSNKSDAALVEENKTLKELNNLLSTGD